MSYWWVNHGQTSAIELSGGYIWSPKHKKGGAPNQAYLNLTLTKPLDLIFSYADGKIGAVGVVEKTFMSQSKPDAFGRLGDQWDKDGWLVPISWIKIPFPINPKLHLEAIAPLLPSIYSPIRKDGNGNQGMYLTSISEELGILLLSIIEDANPKINANVINERQTVEENIVESIIGDSALKATYKEQLIKARVGQGFFRMEVEKIEKACRWTGVDNKLFLIASHIKPWKDSSNTERLDGHNGLLLSPHVDKLFDKGYISFNEDGRILISKGDMFNLLEFWNLDPKKIVGRFSDKQLSYLAYHRENIFNQKY